MDSRRDGAPMTGSDFMIDGGLISTI